MKKILILLAAVAVACGCSAQEQPKSARVRVVLPEDANVSMDYTGLMSWVDLGYNKQTASLNTDGVWEMTIPLDRPEYFLLLRNPLYLSPGDDLLIEPSQYPEQSVITGIGAEANNYLKDRAFVKGGSYLASGRNVRPTLEEQLPMLDSIAGMRRAALAALDATDEFKRLETARIDGDYINSLNYYPIYNRRLFGENVEALPRTEYNAIMEEYFARIRPIVEPILKRLEGDDSLLDIEVVRFVLHQCSMHEGYDVKLSERFRQLLEVGETASRISGSMSPEQQARLEAYGETIADPEMRRIYMEKFVRNTRFTGGQPAVDVAVTDLDGVKKMLSDYKGRPMYVDVWATWCGPCIMQAPYFRALADEYPDVTFVALSVDDTVDIWKKYIETKDNGRLVELWAEPEMRRKWDITGIPRFLLIDKDFNIITTDAPRPSNREEIGRLLDGLVK